MRCGAGITVSLLLAAAVVHAAPDGDEGRFVELGDATSGERRLLARVDLDAIGQRELSGGDPHYDGTLRMRGAPLAEVWARVAIPARADLAVLRFDNGLQIRIPFRDAAFMARLGAAIVRAATTDRWAPLVPGKVETPRRAPTEEDLRVVTFHGNRVVVANDALPAVLPSVVEDLHPWVYADSLFAIDFVERAAWEAKFDAGPSVASGQRVFVGTCAFCHAVRGAGAALGWDLVDPAPIYSDEWLRRFRAGVGEMNRTPPRTMLQIHVRHRAGVSGARTMPALRGMTTPELKALLDWMEASARRSPP